MEDLRACHELQRPVSDFRFAVEGKASAILVIDDDSGHLTASVLVGHDGHRGWLYYVAVAPSARGQGLGRQIVKAGEQWLRERGVVKVQLLVRETNRSVVAFYEHLGFEVAPRVVMGKWLQEEPETAGSQPTESCG